MARSGADALHHRHVKLLEGGNLPLQPVFRSVLVAGLGGPLTPVAAAAPGDDRPGDDDATDDTDAATDPDRPVEIAYFDRGPVDSAKLVIGGHWSAYWYNGHIYGSEIGRGLDVLDLARRARELEREGYGAVAA